MKLFHVASRKRDTLEVKRAICLDSSFDFEAVYFSLTVKQAVWWSLTLEEHRKVPFNHFYVVEVPRSSLFMRGGSSVIPWNGDYRDEVLYKGEPITDLLEFYPCVEFYNYLLEEEWRQSFW